jgi:hypothetical protein
MERVWGGFKCGHGSKPLGNCPEIAGWWMFIPPNFMSTKTGFDPFGMISSDLHWRNIPKNHQAAFILPSMPSKNHCYILINLQISQWSNEDW